MADQELGLKLKTTSDVPEAMGKAKAATTSFAKQVEDIQKKFSTTFKDIFLGFLAPMVIINKVMSTISEAVANIKQQSKDALAFGADQTNKYVNEQESAIRRLIQLRDEDNRNRKLGEQGTREAYADILMNTPEGQKIFAENRKIGQGFRPYKEGDILKGFDQIAAEEMAKNPAIRAQLDAIVAKMLPGLEKDKTPTSSYKTPEGVNAVVGVGNNAAMQAMLDSLEEQRKQTMLLEQLAQSGGNLPSDFTKSTTAAPSRSYLLTK